MKYTRMSLGFYLKTARLDEPPHKLFMSQNKQVDIVANTLITKENLSGEYLATVIIRPYSDNPTMQDKYTIIRTFLFKPECHVRLEYFD